jgi:hypothetical protein
MRLEVLAMVLLKIQVSWDVMQCQWAGSRIHTLFALLDPEGEGTMSLQNVVHYLPTDTVSHPRRLEF